ncbi:hypothetical protein K788_00012305 [Paraburkholderia caribensis MBA4]|uniref:Uncharacterized protein n=1 Tax=Paraburkholderia caribensis MBA4 TaxID=1323664 RepID=A0A0P0R9S7_9BURK|nr:hypothetical protein K788_00012305 [Paraburkholderia caribensis MBA4]
MQDVLVAYQPTRRRRMAQYAFSPIRKLLRIAYDIFNKDSDIIFFRKSCRHATQFTQTHASRQTQRIFEHRLQ